MLDDPEQQVLMLDLAEQHEERVNDIYLVCFFEVAACGIPWVCVANAIFLIKFCKNKMHTCSMACLSPPAACQM